MNLSTKLDEVFDRYAHSLVHLCDPMDQKQAKEQILQAVTESLPDTLLSIEDGKSEHYARGYNRAIRDIKDILEGKK